MSEPLTRPTGKNSKVMKKLKVCEDEDNNCESEIRWGRMTEMLQNAKEVRLINMVRDEFTTIDPIENRS